MKEYDDPESPYENVNFSVVHHPDNHSLAPTMKAFRDLTSSTSRFGWFTSRQLMAAVERAGAKELSEWASWYRDLYRV